MDELNGVGTLADAGGHPLHGTIAYVAGDENTRDTGFEKPGVAFERPSLGRFAVVHEIRAGQEKALFVALDDAGKPFRSRSGADKDKQRIRRGLLNIAGCGATDRDAFEMLLAKDFDHLRIKLHVDVFRLAKLVNEIL